jgi:hypothetical protein
MRFSQSLLDKFDSCELSMQYAIEDPVYRTGSSRAVGHGYHAGLEHRYRTETEGQRFPDSELSLAESIHWGVTAFDRELSETGENFIWDEKVEDRETAVDMITRMLTALWETENGLWPSDWPTLGVELPWELEHNGVTITSRGIDLIKQDPNDWIIGIDHKTAGRAWGLSKHHARKKAQGPLYVWALQQLFPGAPGYRFAYDVIRYPLKRATKDHPAGWVGFERRIADPEPAHIAAALARVEQAAWLYEKVRSVGMDMPANPTSTLCSPQYCDFFTTCPFGASLDTPFISAA